MTTNRTIILVAVLVSAYVAAQMISDVTSLKITEIAGFSVDAGTLVYPITFTVRDLIHKVGGAALARVVIVTAAVANLAMAGFFWLAGRLPAVPGVGPQTDLFGDVLSPVWRIVFASIIAEVVSELIDTEAYSAWVRRFGARFQWGRVLASNTVSLPVDSAIFVVLAFVGTVSATDAWEIFAVNVVVKGVVAVASIPLIYTVGERPAEGTADVSRSRRG